MASAANLRSCVRCRAALCAAVSRRSRCVRAVCLAISQSYCSPCAGGHLHGYSSRCSRLVKGHAPSDQVDGTLLHRLRVVPGVRFGRHASISARHLVVTFTQGFGLEIRGLSSWRVRCEVFHAVDMGIVGRLVAEAFFRIRARVSRRRITRSYESPMWRRGGACQRVESVQQDKCCNPSFTAGGICVRRPLISNSCSG